MLVVYKPEPFQSRLLTLLIYCGVSVMYAGLPFYSSHYKRELPSCYKILSTEMSCSIYIFFLEREYV